MILSVHFQIPKGGLFRPILDPVTILDQAAMTREGQVAWSNHSCAGTPLHQAVDGDLQQNFPIQSQNGTYSRSQLCFSWTFQIPPLQWHHQTVFCFLPPASSWIKSILLPSLQLCFLLPTKDLPALGLPGSCLLGGEGALEGEPMD